MLSEAFEYDLKPYFQEYPYMAHTNGSLDGNSILYAGTYGLLYFKLFRAYPNSAEHSTLLYKNSLIESGVINKGPHKANDPQTHDDYVGLCSLSFLNHGGAANAIYLHGKLTGWEFNNLPDSGWKNWFNSQFWRIPGVIQHIKLCARVNWSIVDKFMFSISIIGAILGPQDDTSGKILKWHMITVYELSDQKNWFCSWIVRKWKAKTLATYSGGMGDVFNVYYGPSHPFVKWAQGII